MGDRVRVTRVTWAHEKHLIGREGVVTEVMPGLLANGFKVRVGGNERVYGARHIELVRGAQDGEHVKLPSEATMVVGAAPKAGEILDPERMAKQVMRLPKAAAVVSKETARDRVFAAVHAERIRQAEMWPGQWEPGVTDPTKKLAILVEEVGEVARELLENDGRETPHLATELVQCAAVIFAWLESIDGESAAREGEEWPSYGGTDGESDGRRKG